MKDTSRRVLQAMAVILVVGAAAVTATAADRASSLQPEMRWQGVVTDGGFADGEANYEGVWSLVVFDDHLYASTISFGADPGIWRSGDGRQWQSVQPDGLDFNILVGPMTVFEEQLYVGSWNTDLYRSADGVTFEVAGNQAFGPRRMPTSYAVFQGALYVGTDAGDPDSSLRGQVWRSADGADWQAVVSDGFGDPANLTVRSLLAVDGALYAGTYNGVTGCEVWRSFDGSSWVQVGSDGFGDAVNQSVSVLHQGPDGRIYAATEDDVAPRLWRTASPFEWEEVDIEVLAAGGGELTAIVDWNGRMWAMVSRQANMGAEVWSSVDGSGWQPQVAPLGSADNEAAFSAAVFRGSLYVGTFKPNGAELWCAGPVVVTD